MIKLFKWLIPKENKRKASDIGYTGMDSAGRQYRIYAPTVSVPGKDNYHKEPFTLPKSIDNKVRGYRYEDDR